MKTFVAVVMTKDGTSRHINGHHAAWVGSDRNAVISKALKQCNEWKVGRPERGYFVAVGELVERADEPVTWVLNPLHGTDIDDEVFE